MRSFLLSLGLVLAALVATPSPAHAAPLEINYAGHDFQWWIDTDMTIDTSWAHGSFDDDGDRFYLKDKDNDGMRVAIHWKLQDGSRRGLCIVKGGQFAEGVCNKNLPENVTVLMRLGRCDGDVKNCETLDGYRDWTAYKSTSTSKLGARVDSGSATGRRASSR